MKPAKIEYCATCGHSRDRHSVANLGRGAPCGAPLGQNRTCTCKGFVRIKAVGQPADRRGIERRGKEDTSKGERT